MDSPVRFVVSVLGSVRVEAPDAPNRRDLSTSKRNMLAVLVAAGPKGLAAAELARLCGPAAPLNNAALRMSVARLRDCLPHGAIPESESGRYRLDLRDEQVDAWYLSGDAAKSAVQELGTEVLRHLLQPAEPFEGAMSSAFLDDAAREIRGYQRDLLALLGARRPDVLSGDLVGALLDHSRSDPLNERLLLLTVSQLADLGDRRGALNLIATARREFAEIGLTAGRRVDLVEAALLEGRDDVVPERLGHRTADSALPDHFCDLLTDRFIGSSAALRAAWSSISREQLGVTSLIVAGPSGVGKSRILAEIGQRGRLAGWNVSALTPSNSSSQAALAPLLAALPELHTIASELLASGRDAESRRADLWTAARSALATRAADRRLVLLVDDAQWLDSQSVDLVAHLLGSVSRERIAIVVAGRTDVSSAPSWAPIVEAAKRLRSVTVEPAPFTGEEMVEFVRQRVPRISGALSLRLAGDLLRRSGGWPGVAAVMLACGAPLAGRLPDAADLARRGLVADSARRLSTLALTTGAVAAVIGDEFELNTVSLIAGLPLEDVLDGVDELVRHDLLVERSPVRFAIVHSLAEATFLAGVPRRDLARWHLAAAAIESDDIHRAAWHAVESTPFTSAETARAALLRSARAHLEGHLAAEARAAYERARDLTGVPLDPLDIPGYSRALDLMGAHDHATAVRADYLGDPRIEAELALAIAVSGLPEAEPIDGSEAIVGALLRIDAEALSRRRRWELTRYLARQLAIVGRLDEATTWARRAIDLAETADERVAAAHTFRFAISATSEPQDRLAVLDRVAAEFGEVDELLQAEFLVLRAIDNYELGDGDEAERSRAALAALPGLPTLRRWHAVMLEAMFAADAGASERAAELRTAAFEIASRAGLWEADNAHLLGVFLDLFVANQCGALIDGVRNGTLDPTANVMTRAGIAAVLHAAGEFEEAHDHAVQVVRVVHGSPVAQGISALLMIVDVLASSPDEALKATVVKMLECRGDSMVVAGAGAASFGPVKRYVARLHPDPGTARRHVRAALELAERARSPRWIDVCTADLERLERATT